MPVQSAHTGQDVVQTYVPVSVPRVLSTMQQPRTRSPVRSPVDIAG